MNNVINGKIKHYKTIFSFYLSGCPAIFLLCACLNCMTKSLAPLMVGFLCVYLFTVLFTIFYFGWISLYSIFLYTSLFFVYDCFIFTLLGEQNFLIQTYPKRFEFSEDVGRLFIIVCFVCVYVMHITYCMCKKNKMVRIIDFSTRNDFIRFGKLMMFIFFIPILTKIYLQVSYISTHGYTSFYSEKANIQYPFWVNGAFTFFITGFVFFISGKPNKKELIMWTLFYFIVFALSSFRGQRGPILSLLLFIIYMCVKRLNFKLKFRHLFLLLIIIVFFTYIMGTVRASYGKKQNAKKSINIVNTIKSVLYNQTTTRAVPLLIINGDIKNHNYPFIFWPVTISISKRIWPEGNRTEISGIKYNRIGSTLMYNVSQKAYLEGKGYGGAFIGEAYDCFGFVGLVFWSIVLAYICALIDFVSLNLKPKYLPLIILFLLDFGLLPRHYLLNIFSNPIQILLIFAIIILLNSRKYIFAFQQFKKL